MGVSLIIRTLNLAVLIRIKKFRICIISVIRIVAIKRLNVKGDVTYDGLLDDICTALEPTLGVINACLPILQPVVSKISGSTSLAWSRLRSSGGTSRARLRPKGTPIEPSADSQSGRFHRLPADLYPLSNISDCTGPAERAVSDKEANPEFEDHCGIKVKQYVGVQSKSAPRF